MINLSSSSPSCLPVTVSVNLNPTTTTKLVLNLLENCRNMSELRQIHGYMIKTNLVHHTFAISRVMSFCSLSGDLNYASSVLTQIQNPNAFIFFTAIKGFSRSSTPFQSFVLYCQMLSCLESFYGVRFSIPSVLEACGKVMAFEQGRQVHAHILKTQLHFDMFVMNGLIRMYLELVEIELARRVFDKMPNKRDIVSWNSMLTGYLRAGQIEIAASLFGEMPERDLVSYNSMIDGFGKSSGDGKLKLAEDIFRTMTIDKDIVTWTSMISAYVLNDRPREALHLFRNMLDHGVRPDSAAIVSVLSAIADLGFGEEGKWIHTTYISTTTNQNKISLSSGFIGSALIDMYSKCGYIGNARKVFKIISRRRNVGDWNSMISGLALHGLGYEACQIFIEMERLKIEPNEITFLGLLCACSHNGLIIKGRYYFKTMSEKYNIVPKIQHYGCMVDLLSRAGHLEEALEFIQNMPVKADLLAWKGLLSASMKHSRIDIGENAALRAIELAPKDSSSYVILSNIYAKAERWDDVGKLRLIMRNRGVIKIPGCSSIVVDGKVHEFLAGKELDARNDNSSNLVLSKVEEIVSRLKLEGYVPDLTQVLLDIEEEGKARSLSLHSEKMAAVFGLINLSNNNNNGVPEEIRIVKNLRICCDCHAFMKLVSGVYKRRIIVRDQNRFHHFEDGSCSCKDYW